MNTTYYVTYNFQCYFLFLMLIRITKLAVTECLTRTPSIMSSFNEECCPKAILCHSPQL